MKIHKVFSATYEMELSISDSENLLTEEQAEYAVQQAVEQYPNGLGWMWTDKENGKTVIYGEVNDEKEFATTTKILSL